MFSILSEGFVLGLSTGFYCLTTCLPALVPYLLSEGDTLWRTNFGIFLEFLAGRFTAYFLFAVVSTLIGVTYKPYLPVWAAPLAMSETALAMLCAPLDRPVSCQEVVGARVSAPVSRQLRW